MKEYIDNKKINKKNENILSLGIPFGIENGHKIAEGGESEVWEIKIRAREGSKETTSILKISKDEAFSTNEEMNKAEEFYRFLKDSPDFGKFIPDTIYFRAKETEEDTHRAFCIQQFIQGERIDKLTDNVIYRDTAVVAQLLELVNASIKVLQTVRKDEKQNPDFMRTPESNNPRALFGALVFDPRYSSNIMIANKPNENGQQVFFVDVGVNANARRKKGWEWQGRKAINITTEIQFKEWKKKLEDILTQGPVI